MEVLKPKFAKNVKAKNEPRNMPIHSCDNIRATRPPVNLLLFLHGIAFRSCLFYHTVGTVWLKKKLVGVIGVARGACPQISSVSCHFVL